MEFFAHLLHGLWFVLADHWQVVLVLLLMFGGVTLIGMSLAR